MKYITRPTETIDNILDVFLTDNVQPRKTLEINNNRAALETLEEEFISKTEDNTLFEISRGIPDSISLDKKTLVKFYEYRILEKENGRKFYDKLILSIPHNICPYCTIKNVTTVDHFLPKSEYPFLSVTPANLVPSCRDCNTDKKVSYPTNRDDQTFHPYFDIVDNEPWIIAELLRAEPLSFHFKVQRMPTWDDNKYNRSLTHFDAYKINELFSSEANKELRGRRLFFKRHIQRNRTELIDHLNETYQSYLDSFGLLDWRTVMYNCLINDDWFLDGCAGSSYFN